MKACQEQLDVGSYLSTDLLIDDINGDEHKFDCLMAARIKTLKYDEEMMLARRASEKLKIDVENVILDADFTGSPPMLKLFYEAFMMQGTDRFRTMIDHVLTIGVSRGDFKFRPRTEDDEPFFEPGEWPYEWHESEKKFYPWSQLELYVLFSIIEKKVKTYLVPYDCCVLAPDKFNYRGRGYSKKNYYVADDAASALSKEQVNKIWKDISEDAALLRATKLSHGPDLDVIRCPRGCSNAWAKVAKAAKDARKKKSSSLFFSNIPELREKYVDEDGELSAYSDYML
jgi:hypothetical protein